ncbi:MAG: AAA family ATPase [Candidatus Limnocylindrales bacterium]
MSPRYTSARFVGREDAFTRLASVLQSAAVGDAGALLIDGTAGVGVTRFIDEAVRRVGTLREPTLVLRGCASPDDADRPYRPVLQALGPMLAALRDDELARVMGTATDELMALLPGLADRIDPARIPGRRWLTTGPERRQARVLEGVLGVVGRLERAAADAVRDRGPPPGRCGDSKAARLPGQDRPIPATLDRRHLPGRRDAPHGSLGDGIAGARARSAAT